MNRERGMADKAARPSRTNVLLILTSLARSSGGGISFATGLAQSLAAGTRLTVVLPRPSDAYLPASIGDVRMLEVRPLSGFRRIIRDFLMAQRWATNCSADVVVLPHEWGLPLRGVNLVNVVQNVYFLKPPRLQRGWAKALLMFGVTRLTAPLASTTVAVSDFAAARWRESTGRIAEVAHQGVDPRFRLAATPKKSNLIVLVTGPHQYKRPDLAAEVAHRLWEHDNGLRTVVVGLPVDRRAHWECHETLEPDVLASLFGEAEVVAITSELESFGLPAFEARSAGARVVVVAGTAMDEMLETDQGVWPAAPTADSFVRQIIAALGSEPPPPVGRLYEWASYAEDWITLVEMAGDSQPGGSGSG
ncbi:glycosyltransferase family 4 protein [Pedococcus sp. NPDC057267]|uniref:glycosyltransferase family 4 protein n=1 Tax=Pedococcus sp. NPDC057267 TaxID=3346077 RepID=UPI003633A721